MALAKNGFLLYAKIDSTCRKASKRTPLKWNEETGKQNGTKWGERWIKVWDGVDLKCL